MKRMLLYLQKAAPAILTGIAGIGVIATAILSAKATIKVNRLLDEAEDRKGESLTKTEKLKIAAPAYIPVIALGGLTIAVICEINILNKRQQIALASAYVIAKERFQKYRNKVKDIYGEEAHRKIMDELTVENCADTDIIAVGFASNSSLDFQTEEKTYIFHDVFSDRYFESTFSKVLQAEYHLNRNFALSAKISLNDFYNFLGLERTDYGQFVGWSMDTGILWIDFNHHKTVLENGTPCYNIEFLFEPDESFADW